MLLLYADDLVIFAETPDALQLQIDKLYNYCQKWSLEKEPKPARRDGFMVKFLSLYAYVFLI